MHFRILLLAALNFMLSAVYGQNMLTNSSVWTYDIQEKLPVVAHGYTKYSVAKDTLLDNKQAKVITRTGYSYRGVELSPSTIYMYEEESKVYLWQNNQFKLMYNFDLTKGDTLRLEVNNYGCDSISPIIIDSVTEITVNAGQTLKKQHISYTTYYDGIQDLAHETILENVGDERFFTYSPRCGIWDNFAYTGLRCYRNETIEFKNAWWKNRFPQIDCEEWVYDTETSLEDKSSLAWEVFVNSIGDVVVQSNNTDAFFFELYDASGRTVTNGTGNSKTTISTNKQPSGMYFLKVFSQSSETSSYRLMK